MNNGKRIFISRFYEYQKERFPFIGHFFLIGMFTFSAVAFSLISRGKQEFINPVIFFAGVIVNVGLFYLVRVFDEHKDAEDDALYRKTLPVPRGLVSLTELRNTGIVSFMIIVLVQVLVIPEMLWIFAIIIGYLLLMGKEFFVAAWLKERQLLYITSHMFIIPLVDIFSSGLDWLMDDGIPPATLTLFFIITYFNGLVLEFGRKLRAPSQEEPGVKTYSAVYGFKKAAISFLLLLAFTFVLAVYACILVGHGNSSFILLSVFLLFGLICTLLYIGNPLPKRAKLMEICSVLWTFILYLSLGGIPMLFKIFGT